MLENVIPVLSISLYLTLIFLLKEMMHFNNVSYYYKGDAISLYNKYNLQVL